MTHTVQPFVDLFSPSFWRLGSAMPKTLTTGVAGASATDEKNTGIIADAAAKTGRQHKDFEVEEISRERYEKLKRFLD